MLSPFIGIPYKSREGEEAGVNDTQLLASTANPKRKVGSVIYTSSHSQEGIDTKAKRLLRVLRELLNKICMWVVSLRSLVPCVRARVYFQIIYLQSVVIGALKSFVKVNKFTREIFAGIKSNKNFKMKNNASRK